MWALDEEDENNVVVALDIHTEVTQFRKISNNWEEEGLEVEVGEYSEELKKNFDDLVTFVKDSTDEEFIEHFSEYIDFESALNYIIVGNIINGYDNVDKNLMIVTYDQKLWYPSLYDLDATYGQNWHGTDKYNYEFLIEQGGSLLWERFNKLFRDKIVERYSELRKNIITKDYIIGLFESFKSTIPETLYEKDRERWPNSCGLDYDQIEEYLDYKLPYLDEYYGYTE